MDNSISQTWTVYNEQIFVGVRADLNEYFKKWEAPFFIACERCGCQDLILYLEKGGAQIICEGCGVSVTIGMGFGEKESPLSFSQTIKLKEL